MGTNFTAIENAIVSAPNAIFWHEQNTAPS